ncbi:MAG: hypothetical protein SVT52_05730 [Planctomycetota bacterium]|nr:hypothetical protein [Planctomycetota bacterium]
MQWGHQEIRLQLDGYTRVCLTAIAVLLTILVAGLWAEKNPMASEAGAADKIWLNSASQRKAFIDVQTTTNTKLDELMKLLKSGQVKVEITPQNLKELLTGEGEADVPVPPKK